MLIFEIVKFNKSSLSQTKKSIHKLSNNIIHIWRPTGLNKKKNISNIVQEFFFFLNTAYYASTQDTT